jgi:hypothetical protein
MLWARKLNWFLSQQLGIDIRRLLRAPWGAIRFVRDLIKFSRTNSLPLRLQPCLHDWWAQAGAISNEYFWQDLFVARMVHRANPRRHIDVGSRLDGFVAHLATFREVEVFDVRKLDIKIPGVHFQQANLMEWQSLPASSTDSVSCLHAIEHFGLGRYGDPLDSLGVEKGMKGLSHLLETGGKLYLSCPAGPDVIHFNAHRSLRPERLIAIAEDSGLQFLEGWIYDCTTHQFETISRAGTAELRPDQTLAICVFSKN